MPSPDLTGRPFGLADMIPPPLEAAYQFVPLACPPEKQQESVAASLDFETGLMLVDLGLMWLFHL